MDMTGRTPITGADGEVLGWMSPPDREQDTVPVILTDRQGELVGMTRLDVDYFGEIDDALVPVELIEAELTAHYWRDEPGR